MKRLAILMMMLSLALPAAAQNNAYAIDDECFVYFTQSEHSVDDFESDAFETAQQQLLETSLRKKDVKAQTLYSVEQLKRTSHYAQHLRKKDIPGWDKAYWNDKMEKDRETVQRISRSSGYTQYYYYATELSLTYFYNTKQDIMAEEMLTGLMEEARLEGDEYAMWKTLMYLGKLYLRTSDQHSSQKTFREVVRIYEASQDPMIKRQSICNQLCDLADTYPIASDSARLFYSKAEEGSVTLSDTIRVKYYKAQLAAWDNDISSYRQNRDYCLSKPSFPSMIRGAKPCFECIDNILASKPTSAFLESIHALHSPQQMSFASHFAARRGQWETAAAISFQHIDRLYKDIHFVSSQRINQMAAQWENNRLEAKLEAASRRVTRITVFVGVLITLLLLSVLIYALIRKNKKI